jgi:hypothetical protein
MAADVCPENEGARHSIRGNGLCSYPVTAIFLPSKPGHTPHGCPAGMLRSLNKIDDRHVHGLPQRLVTPPPCARDALIHSPEAT